MKRNTTRALVVCALVIVLLTLGGCKLYRYSLRADPFDQEGSTLHVYYRLTNLGDENIIQHTICFNVTTDRGTFSFSRTENALLEAGSSGVGEQTCTVQPLDATVTDVTIGSCSVVWE